MKRNLLLISVIIWLMACFTLMIINGSHNEVKKEKSNIGIIYIGDIRTYEMFKTTNNENEFFIKESEKNNFLKDEMPGINNIVNNNTQYKQWKIIICNELSDLDNINNSLDKINNAISTKLKNYDVYVTSINPVDSIKMEKNNYKVIQNSDIEKINNVIKSNIKNAKYIDTYNYILESSITTDGIYYNEDTYKDIHMYINRIIDFE